MKKAKRTSPYGTVRYKSIDEYHAAFPATVQKLLQQLRDIIRVVAPTATEAICYNIPTFKLNKNLVHYAAYKNHIGFYPTTTPLTVFKKDLEKYKTSKGAIQFPFDQPLPFTLIKKIVRYRVKEDSANNHPRK